MEYKIDKVDKQILNFLIDNARMPFTDIAKKLVISAGTVYIRVKKMEDFGIIKGSSLTIDYDKLGCSYTLHLFLGIKTNGLESIMKALVEIPYVTGINLVTGSAQIMCKVRTENREQAKSVLFKISDIEGVVNVNSFVTLEEAVNDKKRLMHSLFNNEIAEIKK